MRSHRKPKHGGVLDLAAVRQWLHAEPMLAELKEKTCLANDSVSVTEMTSVDVPFQTPHEAPKATSPQHAGRGGVQTCSCHGRDMDEMAITTTIVLDGATNQTGWSFHLRGPGQAQFFDLFESRPEAGVQTTDQNCMGEGGHDHFANHGLHEEQGGALIGDLKCKVKDGSQKRHHE